MKNRNSKKGFTLVEIMIVVVIIGLLAAMAIPAFQKVRQKSRQSAVENNIRQIASAADQYFMEYGVTSVALADLVGTNSFMKTNPNSRTVAGEAYDTTVEQGQAYEITFSGGGSIEGTW